MIPNLELRDDRGASIVLGGPGTARSRGYIAALGVEVPGDRDTPTAAGVVYLTGDDLDAIIGWAVHLRTTTDPTPEGTTP